METRNGSKLRVLMFPWIAHGHVFPYLELSKNLSSRNFHMYFCSTTINLDSIKNSLHEHSSIQLVELQLPSFPDLPPHFHTTKYVPPNLMPRLFHAFQMSISSFTDIITNLKPDLLIYDVFQPWAARIAASINIPAVHFATTGAAAYSFVYHMFTDKDSTFPYPVMYLKDNERKALQAAIGQLISDDDDGAQSDNEENGPEIVEWLSKKPEFSTVFISFGSENYFSKDQMQEIAKGLELCNVNFIWVVRSPVGETININEIMPMGFLHRVKDRGIILEGWAPQAKILAHKSIGAFMSHCGMSSIFESLYFGVPVIAVPLKLDQPLNARFLVEAGAGVEVARDEDGNLRRQEVANVINKVIVDTCGERLRFRAMELSEKMKCEEEEAMNEAAEQLLQLCIKFKEHN
ncbi:crocetin glucoside glucosyltransferase-like [Dorcoceras hygrometricum]|uniref:Glycosyltransferase n=1 Tax=Dorcoceras hygrometricum TaxID=472368 RepID=A0A2Z7D1B0_9LAMI|nr:crocetin glucoside glucosyltransferase-like [Dorcoceras hygrometricum]